MICAAVSNRAWADKWLTSPVCGSSAGRVGNSPIRAIASRGVAGVSGLAGLLKPIWLSLI